MPHVNLPCLVLFFLPGPALLTKMVVGNVPRHVKQRPPAVTETMHSETNLLERQLSVLHQRSRSLRHELINNSSVVVEAAAMITMLEEMQQIRDGRTDTDAPELLPLETILSSR